MPKKSTQSSLTDQINQLDQLNKEQLSPNWLIAFVMLAIAVAFGFFYYIFTHGTSVPYLGPIGG